jgi:F0F1-type ATP synthase assembly protein I
VVIDVKHVVPLTLLAQLCVSIAVAGGAWAWFGTTAGVSALLGGATAVLPNGFLAARLLQSNRDPRDSAMMRAAWIGELGKLLLTALLFAVIFRCRAAVGAARGVRGVHRRAVDGFRGAAARERRAG